MRTGPLETKTTRGVATRLFVAVALPTALLVIGLGIAAWQGARGAVAESQTRELRSATVISATRINSASARFLLPGDEDSRTYQRLTKKLREISEATGSVRVLLANPDEKVVADAGKALKIGSPVPRLALDRAEFRTALKGTAAVSVPFEAKDGRRFLAAYAPVPERDLNIEGLELPKDDEGPLVLILEAPAELLDATDRVATYLFVVVFLFVILVFVLASVVAGTITRPLRQLAMGARALGQGELTEPLELPSGEDEVALLGNTLEGMRRALNERDQERQMMLAGIAHEVRNPLGGMELFSGLLEEGIDELPLAHDASTTAAFAEAKEELLSHAGRVRRELHYLKGVVNDFLAFARELPPERTNVDIRALCDDVAALTKNKDGAPLKILCTVEGTFPLDRGRIKEALLNLVENAKEATGPEGTVVLRAFLDDDSLLFEVEDEGRGMDPETADRVFQPFFTTREKGSGLGLPLVRKFARDHGGDAELSSTLGRGTCVRLTLARGTPSARSDDADLQDGFDELEPALLGVGDDDAPSAPSDAEDANEDDAEEPALLGDG